jgi:hypothetical protein
MGNIMPRLNLRGSLPDKPDPHGAQNLHAEFVRRICMRNFTTKRGSAESQGFVDVVSGARLSFLLMLGQYWRSRFPANLHPRSDA